jgi:hypothetical protein
MSQKMPSQSWYRKRYGTWNNALKAAGLPVKEEFKKPTLSKKDLGSKLVKLRTSLGRDFNKYDLVGRDKFVTLSDVCKTFGTITDAKKYIGGKGL